MKALKVFTRIIEVICIIACVVALLYIATFIIDSSISIANYDPAIEDASDPRVGIGLGGALIFALGIYYSSITAGVSLIPLIMTFAYNGKAKKTGTKKMGLWLPIALVLFTPLLEFILLIFIKSV